MIDSSSVYGERGDWVASIYLAIIIIHINSNIISGHSVVNNMSISFIVIKQDINMISYHLQSYWHCLFLYLLPWRVCMTSLFVIFWEDFLTANSMAIVNRSDRLTLRAPAISYHIISYSIMLQNITSKLSMPYFIILYYTISKNTTGCYILSYHIQQAYWSNAFCIW